MDKLVVYDNLNEIEKQGNKVLSTNKFFSDLCNLMNNIEFIKFHDEYLKNWSDIQCMIFYMKLYTTIEFEYNRRYNNKISSAIMTYMLKQIMATDATRKYALDLFADFKECATEIDSVR